MANIIVETEATVSGTPVLTTVSSNITYDGSSLTSIDFDPSKTLNTNFSQMNSVIGVALADIATNKTNITTNTTNITTIQTQVNDLDVADIDYNGSLTQNCFDFSSATSLDDILQLILDQACTNKTDIATINATSAGKPWTPDYEIFFEDYVQLNLDILGTSGLNVTVDAGVAMNDASRIDKAQTVLVMTATKDNYIDLQFDGDYDVKAVTVSAAAPALGSGEQRLYKITTDATTVTGTSDLRRITPIDGDGVIADDSLSNAKLTDSGVTAAAYTMANLTVNSKGILTVSASGDASMTNSHYPRRTAAGTWADSTIYDDGTNIGLGTTDPQAKLTLADGNSIVENLTVPSGVGTSLQSGGSLADATTFYYVVTALDGTGQTIASSEVSDTTATPNLTIRITWSVVTGAVSYRVYKGTTTGTYTEYFSINAPTLQYDDDATAGTGGSPPASTTAYSVKFGNGNGWILDNLGVGTSTPSGIIHAYEKQNGLTSIIIENDDSVGTAARTNIKLQETAAKSLTLNYYNTAFANSFVAGKAVLLSNDDAAGMLFLNNNNSGPIDFAINVDDDAVAATDVLFRVDLQGVGVGTTSFGTNATKTLAMLNGVAPTTSPANIFQMYSDDIVAGNAAPHFRTEGGDIVKLFKAAALTAVDATAINATYDAVEEAVLNNVRTRLNEIETLLQANGLLT